MSDKQQTIALAGVGNVGKYIYEELAADDRFDVVVISRQVSEQPKSRC
jgi:saccharopine dehydrogenase-like NADP-dependent oxidoreductase